MSEDVYLVPSERCGDFVKDSKVDVEDDFYEVNTAHGLCDCPQGRQGRLCKHQVLVWKFYGCSLPNFPAVSPEAKYEFLKVALGDGAPGIEFLQPLSAKPHLSSEAAAFASESGEVNIVDVEPQVTDSGAVLVSVPPYVSTREALEAAFDRYMGAFKDSLLRLYPNGSRIAVSGLDRLTNRVNRSNKTGVQFQKFIHGEANGLSKEKKTTKRAGGRIGVNSEGIKRRKLGKPRGSMPLATGRKARKHNLMLNVKLNQPNAKKHH